MDLLTVNTISYLLLAGVIISLAGKLVRLPVRALLLLTGMGMSGVYIKGIEVFSLSRDILYLILVFSLPLIVFDTFSRLQKQQTDSIRHHALEISTTLLLLSSLIMSIAAYLSIGQLDGIIIALFFGIVIIASAPYDNDISIPRLYRYILGEESLVSNAITIVFAFGIITTLLIPDIGRTAVTLCAGLGTGLLIGLILLRYTSRSRKTPSHQTILLLAVVLTFLIARITGASGVFAVAALGLFIGNVAVRRFQRLEEFSASATTIIEMILFITIGLIAHIPLTVAFICTSIGLYLLFLAVRFVVMNYFLLYDHTLRERLFMTLCSPKGSTIGVIVLFIEIFGPHQLRLLIPYFVAIMLYSLIVTFAVSRSETTIVGEKK